MRFAQGSELLLTTQSARAPDIEVKSFRVKQIFINRVCLSWLDDTGGLY
jgi:hypothetical protein